MKLTIFYDGSCPLCVHEIQSLRSLDSKRQLVFKDINQADFEQNFPDIDRREAGKALQAQLSNGKRLSGLDVTIAAWTIVGKKSRIAPLRWRLLRPVADMAYRFFARNRYTISALLTGESRIPQCNQCQ